MRILVVRCAERGKFLSQAMGMAINYNLRMWLKQMTSTEV